MLGANTVAGAVLDFHQLPIHLTRGDDKTTIK
jgi:hypothetical protein